MKQMAWVPVPNKHDGEGFAAIMSHKDGIKLYGLWHLILQVASKCGEHGNSKRPRGTLLRDDGTPHTPRSIALKTRWNKPDDFEWALTELSSSEIAWIEQVELNPAPSCGNPAPSCVEGNGMEENGKKEEERTQTLPAVATPPPQDQKPKRSSALTDSDRQSFFALVESHPQVNDSLRAAWSEWVEVRTRKKKCHDWARMFAKQVQILSEYPAPVAERTLSASIANDWQGLFPEKTAIERGAAPITRKETPEEKTRRLQILNGISP